MWQHLAIPIPSPHICQVLLAEALAVAICSADLFQLLQACTHTRRLPLNAVTVTWQVQLPSMLQVGRCCKSVCKDLHVGVPTLNAA